MRTPREGGRRAAGIGAGTVLVGAGIGCALALAGGALGLQVPTVTVTIPPGSTTITTPPGSTVRTVTVTIPPVRSTTATAPGATPPPPAPPATPPPPASPAPSIPPPPPPAATPAPQAPPAETASDPPSFDRSSEAPASPAEGSSVAAESRSEIATRRGVAGPSLVRPDVYRPPSLQGSYRTAGRPRGSVSVEHGALVPAGAVRRIRDLRLPDLGPRAGRGDVLSRLDFPDFLQGGPARATKRSGTGLPDVKRVLGVQAGVDGDGSAGALGIGRLQFMALSLVLLSSLLLVGALLPPAVIAHSPLSPARFARIRQPLALVAVAILLPVAVGSLVAALS